MCLLQHGFAGTAFGRPVPGRAPHDLKAAVPGTELQQYLRSGVRCGVVAAQPLGGLPVTRYGTVQGIADGIQDAGFPGTRGAVEQKQPMGAELIEIDDLAVSERPEGLDLEPVDPHWAASADWTLDSTSAKSFFSCSSACRERTWSRKPQQISRSSVARASRWL